MGARNDPWPYAEARWAASVTVTQGPFKPLIRVRLSGGPSRRPVLTGFAVRDACEHLFVEHRPLIRSSGRPPGINRTRPVERRECSRHGLTEFAHYSSGIKNGYRWKCKRCIAEAVTRRHQLVRRRLVDEAGGACAICGYAKCI